MTRSFTAFVLAAAAVSLLEPACAHADPRLDEVVYAPYVENHMAELEIRTGAELGNGDLAGARTLVTEEEYGVNDQLALALVETFERAPGQRTGMSGIGVETRWYAGQIPVIGVDVGLYGELTAGVGGEPPSGEAKLLLAKTTERFQGLFNFIVERPLGGPASDQYDAYGYAASATWAVGGGFRLGAEAFGDLGDDHRFGGAQGAYFGPEVRWEGRPRGLPFEIEVDAGWLTSLGPDRGEAPSQARLQVELERRF